jgi:hypothetical protein
LEGVGPVEAAAVYVAEEEERADMDDKAEAEAAAELEPLGVGFIVDMPLADGTAEVVDVDDCAELPVEDGVITAV